MYNNEFKICNKFRSKVQPAGVLLVIKFFFVMKVKGTHAVLMFKP